MPFIEEFPITIDLSGFQPNQTLILKGQNKTTFAGGSETLVVTPESIASGKATFIAESPTTEAAIKIEVTVSDDQAGASVLQELDIVKDLESRFIILWITNMGRRPANYRCDWTQLWTGSRAPLASFRRREELLPNVWQGAPLGTPMALTPPGTTR